MCTHIRAQAPPNAGVSTQMPLQSAERAGFSFIPLGIPEAIHTRISLPDVQMWIVEWKQFDRAFQVRCRLFSSDRKVSRTEPPIGRPPGKIDLEEVMQPAVVNDRLSGMDQGNDANHLWKLTDVPHRPGSRDGIIHCVIEC